MSGKLLGRSRGGIYMFHEQEKASDGRLSEERQEKHAESRIPLWKEALAAAMAQKETIARAMYHGRGWWIPEMLPLTAQERTAIIAELRDMWGIKDSPGNKR